MCEASLSLGDTVIRELLGPGALSQAAEGWVEDVWAEKEEEESPPVPLESPQVLRVQRLPEDRSGSWGPLWRRVFQAELGLKELCLTGKRLINSKICKSSSILFSISFEAVPWALRLESCYQNFGVLWTRNVPSGALAFGLELEFTQLALLSLQITDSRPWDFSASIIIAGLQCCTLPAEKAV
ncbi:vesicle transport through interaction with t-SNAREs homolog 1A isoform X7 [Heterocephalus glaber]|uniref:Vesicle transport through interaction with t-SNAREs homolog 1A isoform X7 n=1 Tax=Heterocephalus glaber TaxID=10181 RepID=A0AAX6SMJ4_HETGA|nr:vesicle transport through interaction with t-SNAREs homolog 1A isoform X7 [Heterocephalus glaber]